MRGWVVGVPMSLLVACGGNSREPVIAIGDDAPWRNSEGGQSQPAAAWNGSSYVASWWDDRTFAFMGQRLDGAGQPLGDVPFVITPDPWNPDLGAPSHLAGVSSAGVMLFAWLRFTGSNVEVVARRIGADGQALDAQPVVLLSGADNTSPFDVAVASDGNEFLVVTTRDRDVEAIRVSSDGSVLGQVSRLAAPACCAVTASWDGNSYLLTWRSPGASPEQRNLAGIRLATDLSWVDADPFFIGSLPQSDEPTLPTPAAAGGVGRHVIAWSDDTGTAQVRSLPGTGAVDLSPEINLGEVYAPAVAAHGDGFVITAVLAAGNGSTMTLLDDAGQPTGESSLLPGLVTAVAGGGQTPLFLEESWWLVPEGEVDLVVMGEPAPVPLLGGRNTQRTPVLASTGELGLAAWLDARGDDETGHIRAARVGPGGEVLDGISLVISDGMGETRPQVASDGVGFLVAWIDGTLKVASVSSAGAVSAATDLGQAPGQPGQWLLIGGPGEYTLFTLDWQRDGVSARKLGADGAWLGDEQLFDLPVATDVAGCNGIAAARVTQGYLLACLSGRDPFASNVQGATVSMRALSAALEPGPWQETAMPWDVEMQAPDWNAPSTPVLTLIPGVDQVLVALKNGVSDVELRLALADVSGNWLEPARSVAAQFQAGLGVSGVWDGSRYLLLGARWDSLHADAWGVWITDTLDRDGSPFPIDSGQSAHACVIGTDVLVAYESFDPAVLATRIRGRIPTR